MPFCEAVRYAHEHAVIHRDLKPSNILVKPDGSVRLLDFGIAKRLDSLDTSVENTATGTRFMTPAYASPEQMRGEPPGVHTDVYSLGVILYQLLAGRLPFDFSRLLPAEAALAAAREPAKPSAAAREMAAQTGGRVAGLTTASWADLDILCLTCMHLEPKRRYASVAALIRDLDHFLRNEPLEARPDTLGYSLGKFVRRKWRVVSATAVAFVVVGGSAGLLGLALRPRSTSTDPSLTTATTTVAVLPFQNASADSSLNFLRLALPDEVASTLSYTRFLTVRPFSSSSRYSDAAVDLQKAGQELRVTRLVTGRFLGGRENVRIEMEALDVDNNRVLWRDTVTAPAGNLIALRERIASTAQGALSVALGAPASTPQTAASPKNEEAYALYLRTAGVPYEPGPNKQAIAMLERAVALDSTYVSALIALSRRYYVDARYESGDAATMARSIAIHERAVALDPNYITAQARLIGVRVEQGELVEAYRQVEDMLRRRPDSPDAHFYMSYVLRFAGLLEEAARECGTAVSLDGHNFGWRSCAVVSLGLGDYAGAASYIQLDPNGEFAKALTIHTLVRQGKELEALQVGRPNMPQWKSYDLLLACVSRKPPAEIARLAAAVQPADDPETNYFAAAHLAYCDQTSAALQLLKRSIQGNYCSYPAIDSDPFFARVRAKPEFAEVRSAAIACQKRFVSQRNQRR